MVFCRFSHDWFSFLSLVLIVGNMEPEPEHLEVPSASAELAQLWENKNSLRNRARAEKTLLLWPNKEAIGIPSIKAIKLNADALLCTIHWWTSRSDEPKTLPIDMIRSEVPLVFS